MLAKLTFSAISMNLEKPGAIVSAIMEIVGNVGKTFIFHDAPQTNHGTCCHEFWRNFGSWSRVSGIMEIVGNACKTNKFHDYNKPIMEQVGFSNISNNFHEFGETSGAKTTVNPT